MKKLFALILLLPLLGFLGCPEDLLEIKFNFELAEATVTLEPQAAAGTYPFSETQITSNLKEEMDKNGADVDKIKSAKAKELTIEIIAPGGTTFDAVESAELFASIPSMASPVLLGNVMNNGAAVTKLVVIPADVELIDLLKEETITFSGNVVTNKAVDQQVTCVIRVTVEVVADPI